MARVRYFGKNVYSCGNVRLLPGVNDVNSKSLKEVLKHPMFDYRVKEGLILVLDKTDKEPSEDEMVDLIKHTYDMEKLEELLSHDSKKVQRAAKKQLKRIHEETEPLEQQLEVEGESD